MQTTTTRRCLLKATPVAAIAVALPTSVTATDSTANPEWEVAKTAFHTAAERYRAACEADEQVDREQLEWCRANPAPERQIVYTEKGWTIERGGLRAEMTPREGKFVLNPSTLRHIPKELEGTQELADYITELEAWKARKTVVDNDRGWRAAHDGWDAAANGHIAAWQALVACPVSTLTHIAEKVDIARKDLCPTEAELELMMESISADIGRTLTHA